MASVKLAAPVKDGIAVKCLRDNVFMQPDEINTFEFGTIYEYFVCPLCRRRVMTRREV